MHGNNRRGEEYLSPILQRMVESKQRLGLPIHLPNMGPAADEAVVTYVHALFDAVIAHYQEVHGKTCRRREYAIFRSVFSDPQVASVEKLKFLHNVAGCHNSVLSYCEAVLKEAGKELPKKPQALKEKESL